MAADKDSKKPRAVGTKPAVKTVPPRPQGPVRFGVKPWQTGKSHPTAAHLAGKARKVH